MRLLQLLLQKATSDATKSNGRLHILPHSFVPKASPVKAQDVQLVESFVNDSRRLFVMTGAGLSTESGLPDYRSKDVGLYERTDRRPMMYQEFVKSSSARRKYWARNYAGWPWFSKAQPNPSHLALYEWEQSGRLSSIVTQNVDRLHLKAGNRLVTELHGSSYDVRCMSCNGVRSRDEIQVLLQQANPGWGQNLFQDNISEDAAPDADINISDTLEQSFNVVPCPACGGVLKPDVVFFGANVPKTLVDRIYDMVKHSDRMLVVGSSLQVYSGYRFLLKAAELNKPICIINIGPTRADHLCDLKVEGKCGDILPLVKVTQKVRRKHSSDRTPKLVNPQI